MSSEKKKESASDKMAREVAQKKHNQMIDNLSRQGVNIKYVTEYKDEAGNVTSRWHFDLRKSMNGPILVETLDFNNQPNAKI